MNEQNPKSHTLWWEPLPLTYVMWLLVAWCGIFGWLGLHVQITTSDPAGNGIGTGIVQGFAVLGLIAVGLLAGLYLLVRWTPFRYVCIALLLLVSMFIPALVR
jgi:hypothetical protein